MYPLVVVSTVEIAAPVTAVWRFVTVLENGPLWQESAVSTTVTTPGPVDVGTRMSHRAKWMGVSFSTRGEVTRFDSASHLSYAIQSVFGASEMEYDLDEHPIGTRLTLANHAQLPGWLRPFRLAITRQVQAMLDRDIARLKAVIEEDASTQRT